MQINDTSFTSSIDSIEQQTLIQQIELTIDSIQTALDQLKTSVETLKQTTSTTSATEKQDAKPVAATAATNKQKRLSKTEHSAFQRAQQWYQKQIKTQSSSSSPPVASIPKSRKTKNAHDNSSRQA